MPSAEYIFQEMLEQEKIAALHRTLSVPDWPAAEGKIIISGSGDSHCAALFGHWLLEKRGKVSGLPSLEASQAAQYLQPGDLFIGISVSGRTARVLEGAKRAQSAGAVVVAVTDNLQSPLAHLATVVWPIHASPAEELHRTNYKDKQAKQYVGYHHDVAQTKTFWAILLTLIRAAEIRFEWKTLLAHTRRLLAASFYDPLLNKAGLWAQSGQTFIVGSGWLKIVARLGSYKMYEYNRLAHFTGIEEYCHTHYFITRTGDTIVFLIADQDTGARAAEVVPVLQELFEARIIWIQSESLDRPNLPIHSNNPIDIVNLPPTTDPLQQFLDHVLAVQWLTYAIGRVDAPNINTFHAGYDTEKLVSGTLRTIRRSAIQKPGCERERIET
ncbi:MAG: SIS domain-containing protein [Deltaproteobacteria bacterium]|nr:SIS domain-containing protein [Deltaproteobacteria bacterium]